MGKRTVTVRNLLRFLNDLGDEVLFLDRYGAWKLSRYGSKTLNNFDDYFPSHVERVVKGLVRRGWVEKVQTEQGVQVKITNKGKTQILMYDLEGFVPKKEKWDKKWRVIFFDVEEGKRIKRDGLRKYLRMLGWKEMQKSVYVCPFDCENEVKYLREVLDVPHGVKMGVLEKVENDEDLRKMFGL